MPTYTEPTWGDPEHVADNEARGAGVFAGSKSDMLALVIELLRSWFMMEDALRHPKVAAMPLRLPGDDAAGLRIIAGAADKVNVNKPAIYVYSGAPTPIHTFVDKISVTTPEFTIRSGGRHGMEYIVLHVYAEYPTEVQALADECSRFLSMMQARLRDVCGGLVDIVPQKGEPMAVDDKGNVNMKVPASYIADWWIVELPEDGY